MHVITEGGRTRHIATQSGWAKCGAMAYIQVNSGPNAGRAAKWPICKRCKEFS